MHYAFENDFFHPKEISPLAVVNLTSHHRRATPFRATELRSVAVAFFFITTASILECAESPSRSNIESAAAFSAQKGGRALLIYRDNRLIFERYNNGHSSNERWKIFSGTKAFWTAAALLAQQQGFLRLEEPVSETITEWKGTNKRGITVRQLLECSSGLDPAFKLHRKGIPDRNTIAVGLPLVAPPGRAFIYGPSHGQVFLELLSRKLLPQKTTVWAYLSKNVLMPLRLRDFPTRTDDKGVPLWATGFELTAREWGEFGRSLLFHSPRILPDGALADALRPSRANPAFGLCFWLNAAVSSPLARIVDVEEELEPPWENQNWRGAVLSKSAPPDLFAIIGSYGQRLYFIPSARLLVVRLGQGRDFRDAPFLDRLFADTNR